MTKGVMPLRPVDGEITKGGGEYGAKRNNPTGRHAGVDYGINGKDVHASLDGVVKRANFSHPRMPGGISYGYVIVLYHGKNVNTGKHTYTLYAHLQKDSFEVKVGDKVERGKRIAISGNTGNVGYHLHFEVIEAPREIDMASPGSVPYGLYRVNPTDFLNRPFSKEPDDLTDEEMDRFYKEIETDFRTEPKPKLLVRLPDYKEFIRKARGEYPSHGVKPPKVRLKFENMFSPAFRSFFPSVDLEVNGRNLGRVQTGTKVYELNVWMNY